MASNRVRPLISGATRNEDKPDPCEVKRKRGHRKERKMKKLLKIGAACIAVVVIIGLISGGSTEPDQTTPEKTIESYLNAIKDVDVDAMVSLANSEGREWTKIQKDNLKQNIIQQKTKMFMSGVTMGDIIKQEVTLQDGRVQVAVSVSKGGSTSFEHMVVKKVGDKWYID